MSQIDTHLGRANKHHWTLTIVALLKLVEQLGAWRRRARERRHLGSFNDRMLKDIGLSRADVDGETTKPFWRG